MWLSIEQIPTPLALCIESNQYLTTSKNETALTERGSGVERTSKDFAGKHYKLRSPKPSQLLQFSKRIISYCKVNVPC